MGSERSQLGVAMIFHIYHFLVNYYLNEIHYESTSTTSSDFLFNCYVLNLNLL